LLHPSSFIFYLCFMRDFFKYTFATLTGLILFVTLGVAGFAALLIAIASSSRETGPRVENDSVLTLNLAQEITDSSASAKPGAILGAALSGESPTNAVSLRAVLQSLRRASTDDRIKGLLIYGSIEPVQSGSGFATLQEVRQALEAFRASGKPIFAYDDGQWQERDYYLASAANTVMQVRIAWSR
jgi:protease IV